MFRRAEDSLDADAQYPADLKQLGFFVNRKGQIRQIKYPDKDFIYNYTNIDRHNVRREVETRLTSLGIKKLYLPALTYTKPTGPHIPILAPPAEVLKTKKRVYVVINSDSQDLGILAYRQLQRELGLNGGSVVDFAKELTKRSTALPQHFDIFEDGAAVEDKDAPGLVVMNPGQLYFSHKFNKALSLTSWGALPRKSISHDQVQLHDENNVAGHHGRNEHIKSVFKEVIHNPDFVSADAEIYVIAIETGAEELMTILGEEWDTYSPRITSLALINSLVSSPQISHPALKSFLHRRAREWQVSSLSRDPLQCVDLPSPLNRNYEPICPTFGGGENDVGECVFTSKPVQHAILAFFDAVAQDPAAYCNPAFTLEHVPQPSPDNPLTQDTYEAEAAAFGGSVDVAMISAEQQALEDAQQQLADMLAALEATAPGDAELAPGRARLEKRIARQKGEVQELTQKALATGGLAKGVGVAERDRWVPQKTGPKIPFAGEMVDAELVKRAGLFDVAEEGLKGLEEEEEEEKADE
ncbi:Arb2 domain-containing protein [Massariosphaeria phaeospora]|uniref:Arb2 domain-containing protein n=1 Tax=Massariosphaeria phaeospora TaxID=100035 RepID=A0A7C8IH69_9PLEO|nr:Arb2 domain-containing protein [Massariosphaeria phaeospora]